MPGSSPMGNVNSLSPSGLQLPNINVTGINNNNNNSGNSPAGGDGTGGYQISTDHWLLGKYSDEDHKILAIYSTFLVGEKCKSRENMPYTLQYVFISSSALLCFAFFTTTYLLLNVTSFVMV